MGTFSSHPRGMHGRIAPQMLFILAAAVALGAGLWAGEYWFGARDAQPPELAGTLTYPTPREVPPFELQQSDGSSLTNDELAGRWTLVFFGFTHCPDICPTTLAQLAQAQRAWQDLPEAKRPRVLFVSVDPERDTPARTGEYAGYFGEDILAATGSHEQLEPFARTLGMVYMKSPLPDAGGDVGADAGTNSSDDAAAADGGNYTVDHSARVAVLDPQVRLTASVSPPVSADVVASDMRKLVDARR